MIYKSRKMTMTADDRKPNPTRAEQKKATREKLIEATLDIIAEGGMAKVTLPKVAERAGFSRGISNFHFVSKDNLLLETLKTVHSELDRVWRHYLIETDLPPADQLKGFLNAVFKPPVADVKKISVWLAYWGETAYRRQYLESFTAKDREYEEAIERLMVRLAGANRPVGGIPIRAIAVALTALIDGCWLQFLIAPGRLGDDEAINACYAYLSRFFPEFRV
jgi:TetR/AcrR family transcriptional repressor of bet genes